MRANLENGLTVVLQENHAARVAALQLWVQVGSADESEDEAGLAHLHEHMLFKGTARRGPGEIAAAVETCGGEINAWTSFDQTVYHLVLPSDCFEEGLDVLVDAVTASAFDPAELEREIEVVVEEIRRSEDSPARRISRELFARAYAVHPYGRPVIGWERTVRSFTRERILDFYRRHYLPARMTLVAVGDFEEQRALESIRRVFPRDGAREGSGPQRPRVGEPEQRGPRAGVITGPVQEAFLNLGWHIGDVRSEDVPALDLLTLVLGQSDSSRLVQEVRRERGLVNEIYASAYTPRDPGLLIAGASLPAHNTHGALREVLRQTYRFRREAIPADELLRAKRMLESDAVYQRETVQGQARKLGFFETMLGHVEAEAQYWDAVARVTPAEIREVARRWLRTDNLTLAAYCGEEDARANAIREDALLEIAAEAEREVATSKASDAPDRPYARLAHGLGRGGDVAQHEELLEDDVRLLVLEDHTVPLVALRAAWEGGLLAETDEENGVAQLLARCLVRGTTRRPARVVSRTVDELAGSLHGTAGRSSFGLHGEFLSAELERVFELFGEVLFEPGLEEEEIARERALQLEELRSRDDNPSSAAFRLFSSTLYDAHPYRLDPLGRAETVQRLDSAALRRHLDTWYRLGGLTLVVAGDVTREAAVRLARQHLMRGRPGRSSRPQVRPDPPLTAPREAVRQLDRKQAHLVVGFRGLTVASPDRPALEVLSAVLSGQGGRLFLELRDKKSLAYSVTSVLATGTHPGYFGVYIGTSPEKVPAARAGIREELERVREERVPEEQLDRARRHLAGTHEIGLQRLGARAGAVALDCAYGLGLNAHREYGERVRAVTAEDVQRVARGIIEFERSVTALVTP